MVTPVPTRPAPHDDGLLTPETDAPGRRPVSMSPDPGRHGRDAPRHARRRAAHRHRRPRHAHRDPRVHRIRPRPGPWHWLRSHLPGGAAPRLHGRDVAVVTGVTLLLAATALRVPIGTAADHVRFAGATTNGPGAASAGPDTGPGPAGTQAGGRTDDTGTARPTPTTEPLLVPPDGLTSAERRLVVTESISDPDLSPKSVVYSPGGTFFAQNMMYRHTVTAYDRQFRRVAVIDDEVHLDRLGHPDRPGTYRGSPVEAAPTSDGRRLYVSNYEMYGPGFTNPGTDDCTPAGYDNSFLYRVDVATMQIDQAIEVGAVPKFVAVTPDDRRVFVSNWCSWDVSVVDAATARETARIPLGPYPRGIAMDAGRNVAYVAVMGTTDIAVIDLDTLAVSWIAGVGAGPRHLVMDPAGRWLYATLNSAGEVARIDPDRREVAARVTTGSQARSMAIAEDGEALYVVNYFSGTVAKVATGSFTVTQTVNVGDQPIGIAYDPATRNVWVALYGGTLLVLTDTAPS